MWIIGLLIGLFVGGWIDRGEGAVIGAVFGTLAGLTISLLKRSSIVTELQQRVQTLEDAIYEVRQELAANRTSGSHAATGAGKPAGTPSTVSAPATASAQPARAALSAQPSPSPPSRTTGRDGVLDASAPTREQHRPPTSAPCAKHGTVARQRKRLLH